MSLNAYIWAADLPVTACSYVAFKVLLRYADNAGEDGTASWVSEARLADQIGCSERTIRRARKELIDADLLRRGDQRHVEHIRADRRPVVYDVMTPPARMIHAQRGTNA